MLTFEEIITETNPIFEKELVLPEPPIKFKDQMEALEEAKLPRQRSACIFEMRNWQAKEMGFKFLTLDDIVKMLMKESHTNLKDGEEQKNEWVYNHHTDKVETNWTTTVQSYTRQERTSLWHLPPFSKQTKWEVLSGKMDYLKREIPYGIVLKINELKKLKIFNSFCIVAPKDAWWTQKEIDPIIYGEIYQLPPDDKGKYTTSGTTNNYFIAKW